MTHIKVNDKKRNSWEGSGFGNIEHYYKTSFKHIKFYKLEGFKKVVAMYKNELWVLTHKGNKVYSVDHKGQITDHFHLSVMAELTDKEVNSIAGLKQSKKILTEKVAEWNANKQRELIANISQILRFVKYKEVYISDKIAEALADIHEELFREEV